MTVNSTAPRVEGTATHRQAVILVGGFGTRLGALTRDTPKPLMPVAGRPFLEHVVRQLGCAGFEEVILLAGYRADRVREALGSGGELGVKLIYSVEDEPMGTAGALALAAPLLAEAFLLVNGDTVFDFDIGRLTGAEVAEPWLAKLALCTVNDTGRYGRVECDGLRICSFLEKSVSHGPGMINAGYYWMRRQILSAISASPASLERDVLPRLAEQRLLAGIPFSGNFIDIGTPEDLARAGDVVERLFC